MSLNAQPAFAAAREICRRHARSFYFASFFLPKTKRDHAYAVYAFCRLIDDAVDNAPDESQIEPRLTAFERRLEAIYAEAPTAALSDSEADQALHAFALTVQRCKIPKQYFLDLADGCRMDLTVHRYATWAELERYCYHVAGVVGLIMCSVFGLDRDEAKRNAITMGNAMQLTNILRDIGEDYQRGRIYLPEEDLRRFNYTESDLAGGVVDERFVALMQDQIVKARRLFAEGSAGLCHLPDDGSRLTAAAMAVIYSGILGAIERQRYDVLHHRTSLSGLQKLCRLPAAWRLSRRRHADPLPAVF